jgi:predicted transcriptional regulator
MAEINELREQVIKLVNNASEKELELVYHLMEATNKSDWWDEIDQEQQEAIDEGLRQLDNGEGISHGEVMRKYDKWLKK